MPNISFTIRGNQNDPVAGNPIPFTRVLSNKWREDSQRYMDWQHYVVGQYQAFAKKAGVPLLLSDMQAPKNKLKPTQEWKRRLAAERLSLKPFRLKHTKVYVHTMIHFTGKNHGDPDNIQKGIVDALFLYDKYVAGSYDFDYSSDGKAGVDINIIILNKIP